MVNGSPKTSSAVILIIMDLDDKSDRVQNLKAVNSFFKLLLALALGIKISKFLSLESINQSSRRYPKSKTMTMVHRSIASSPVWRFLLLLVGTWSLIISNSEASNSSGGSPPSSSFLSVTSKAERIERCIKAKADAGLSFDDLAVELGVTNAYAAQLVLGQAKLSPETAVKMKHALPTLSDEDIKDMQESFPMRGFNDEILKEPNVYRTYEAITHYGEAIKCIINEQCGDGIMSAIDFYLDVGTTIGKKGEKRVVITFNGESDRGFAVW